MFMISDPASSMFGDLLSLSRCCCQVAVGKRDWVAERTAGQASTSGCEEAEAASQTVVYVGVEGRGLVGRMAFSDVLREDAADVVQRLQLLGIRVMLLSGDRAAAAAGVAQQVSTASHLHSQNSLERNTLSRSPGSCISLVEGPSC